MSLSGKTGAGRFFLLLTLAFVCAGICVFKAREFASAAANERTTVAHVVSVYHSIFRGLRFNYYSCSYNFTIDGSLYIGLSDCPQWIIDDAIKERYLGSGAVPSGTDATVYYAPADPSVNSLLEFSAASQIANRCAVPWIGLGALIVLPFIFGRMLATAKGRGGVVVDAQGTVIYPEISPGSEFAGVSNWKTASSTPSQGLREQYLEVVNKIHPDRAANEVDLALRERLMKEANAAFEHGDSETLRRVLEEYRGAISAS